MLSQYPNILHIYIYIIYIYIYIWLYMYIYIYIYIYIKPLLTQVKPQTQGPHTLRIENLEPWHQRPPTSNPINTLKTQVTSAPECPKYPPQIQNTLKNADSAAFCAGLRLYLGFRVQRLGLRVWGLGAIRAPPTPEVAHNARKKGFEFTWKLRDFTSLKCTRL